MIGADVELRVATFNIRCSVAQDGLNAWPHRRARALELIQRSEASVLGLQEVWPDQLRDLSAGLPGWAWMAHDRGDGEMAVQAWRADQFVVRHAEAWMLAPEVSPWGTRGWDGACPRMAGMIELAPLGLATEATLCWVNTHLDHVGPIARTEGVRRILEVIATRGVTNRSVIVGDFNAERAAPALQPLRQLEGSLEMAKLTRPSFHGFGQADPPVTIDHVFAGSAWRVDRVGSQWSESGNASDHDLVYADLTWIGEAVDSV